MDGPRSPMVVAALMEFEGVADLAAFTAALASRLLSHPRFRQRVAEASGRRAWVADGAPNVAYHVRERVLSDPSSSEELRRAVAHELEQGLDKTLPLWRVVLYPRGEQRVAVLFRAHHAIADGVAFMGILLGLADGSRGGAPPRHRGVARRGPLAGMIYRLEAVNGVLESAGEILAEDLKHPERIAGQLDSARRALAALARVVTLPDDNPRPLRAPLGGRRAVAWVDDLSLSALRGIARMQNVTVNDVFLTALAGAFRTTLVASGHTVPETQNLRISVPVNLRSATGGEAGNQFGMVLVDLPVGLEGCAARRDVIAERMAALKCSVEARSVLFALGAAGHLPGSIEKRLVELVAGKAAAVVSNLPGPREALTLAGARIASVTFWPPQAAGLGIGISLLSYAGRVSVGISADTAQLASPQRLLDAFCGELRTMLGRSPYFRAASAARPATQAGTHAVP
jgi:diacylglycerol O-acyltransferase